MINYLGKDLIKELIGNLVDVQVTIWIIIDPNRFFNLPFKLLFKLRLLISQLLLSSIEAPLLFSHSLVPVNMRVTWAFVLD